MRPQKWGKGGLAVRGRKPKPTAIKILAGNPGKRPLNRNEPQPPAPESTPYAPRHLNDEAKREWRRIGRVLLALGLYTEVDRAALAMYCQNWGIWVTAEIHLRDEGEILVTATGYHYPNPWRGLANKAQETMRRMFTEFGLTPSARSRLSMPQTVDEPSLAEQLFTLISADEDDGD